MFETARGVIVRTRLLTETSLIVHWITEEAGRLATVAKGARRAKSPFAGKLDLFFEAEFSFNRSRRSELHTLREVKVTETRSGMRRDIRLLQQAAYAAALVEQTTETETPLEGIYQLLMAFLGRLGSQPAPEHVVMAFELRLLIELGLQPEASGLTEGGRRLLGRLGGEDWMALSGLEISKPDQIELGRFLKGFMIYHIGKIPRGREEAHWAADRPH